MSGEIGGIPPRSREITPTSRPAPVERTPRKSSRTRDQKKEKKKPRREADEADVDPGDVDGSEKPRVDIRVAPAFQAETTGAICTEGIAGSKWRSRSRLSDAPLAWSWTRWRDSECWHVDC